jgi:SAM-dependent methyltransferase
MYLKNRTGFFRDKLKILDIAPMQCFQELCKNLPNVDYVSADIASELAMLKFDITDIPLPDSQFDCIICYHVFEHVPDDRKAMKELYRVLKPGGWAILQVPLDNARDKTFEDASIVLPDERKRVFGQSDHVRIYGRDYGDRLKEVGFSVKIDNYAQQLDSSEITKYGLDKSEEICYCSKPE